MFPKKRKYNPATNTHDPIKEEVPETDTGDTAEPDASAPLGQGGRFAALKQKLSSKPGVTSPGGLAAFIGRKKYGASKFNSLAAKGK